MKSCISRSTPSHILFGPQSSLLLSGTLELWILHSRPFSSGPAGPSCIRTIPGAALFVVPLNVTEESTQATQSLPKVDLKPPNTSGIPDHASISRLSKPYCPPTAAYSPEPLRPRPHPRPLLQQSPHPSPHQQPYSSRNEQKDNNLILPAIALETSREDILLLCAFAEGDSLSEAECAVAFVAGRAAVAGCAGFEKVEEAGARGDD